MARYSSEVFLFSKFINKVVQFILREGVIMDSLGQYSGGFQLSARATPNYLFFIDFRAKGLCSRDDFVRNPNISLDNFLEFQLRAGEF